MTEATPAAAIAVRNVIDGPKLKVDISINVADLQGAILEQASLFVHYAELAANASRQVDDMKMVLEAYESTVYRNLRDEAAKEGTKVTEASLEKSVAIHSKIVSIKRALNEAKQIEAIAKGAVEGFRHRRDMLVQQGATSREELKGELRIMNSADREAAAEATRDRVLDRMRSRSAS